MNIEKTIKFTLDNTDQRAVGATFDIVSDILDRMTDSDTLMVCGSEYSRDDVDEIMGFLNDLWHMDSGTCEIVEN